MPNEGEKAEDETMEGTTSCADVPKEDEKGKHEDTEGTTEATEEYEEVKEEVIKEEPEEEEWTQEQWAEWNAWYDEHIDEEMEEAAMAAEESEVEWVSWPPPPPASILPKSYASANAPPATTCTSPPEPAAEEPQPMEPQNKWRDGPKAPWAYNDKVVRVDKWGWEAVQGRMVQGQQWALVAVSCLYFELCSIFGGGV